MKFKSTLLAFSGWVLAMHVYAALPSGAKNEGKPIEITSDTLEVLQEQNKAIFRGHVVAIQADMRLKSDVMTVYYNRKQGTEAESATPGGGGNIEKIEVEGNVFLSTPKETASGNKGIYDVAKREIRLNQNVVLTQGQNVLKGNAATYNLDTGKSVIASDTSGAGEKGQRVRMLYTPEKKDTGTQKN